MKSCRRRIRAQHFLPDLPVIVRQNFELPLSEEPLYAQKPGTSNPDVPLQLFRGQTRRVSHSDHVDPVRICVRCKELYLFSGCGHGILNRRCFYRLRVLLNFYRQENYSENDAKIGQQRDCLAEIDLLHSSSRIVDDDRILANRRTAEVTLERLGRGTLTNAEDGSLYADVRVPEAQSFDLEIGQEAAVKLGVDDVEARVAELGDSISQGLRNVRLAFAGNLPERVLPGIALDARIQVGTIENALFVGRPAYGQENGVITLFKLDSDGNLAERVRVQVGRASYNSIEVLDGLEEGDIVILSDMSQWDTTNRVALR